MEKSRKLRCAPHLEDKALSKSKEISPKNNQKIELDVKKSSCNKTNTKERSKIVKVENSNDLQLKLKPKNIELDSLQDKLKKALEFNDKLIESTRSQSKTLQIGPVMKSLTERNNHKEFDKKLIQTRVFEPILSKKNKETKKASYSLADTSNIFLKHTDRQKESKISEYHLDSIPKLISPYSRVCFDLDKIKSSKTNFHTKEVPIISALNLTETFENKNSNEFLNDSIHEDSKPIAGHKSVRQPSFGLLSEDFTGYSSQPESFSVSNRLNHSSNLVKEIVNSDQNTDLADRMRVVLNLLTDDLTIRGLQILGKYPDYFSEDNSHRLINLLQKLS